MRGLRAVGEPAPAEEGSLCSAWEGARECLLRRVLQGKEHYGHVLGGWTTGGAELGGNRKTSQSREPQRVRGGQGGTRRGQKTGPCGSGQRLFPRDSSASSETWALVGRLRQGGLSQAPPGLAKTPMTPPPAAGDLGVPVIPLPCLPSPHPTLGLLLDSPPAHHAFLPQDLCLCYSSFQESGLPWSPPSPVPLWSTDVTDPLHIPLRSLHSSCHCLTYYPFFQLLAPQECWAPLKSLVYPAPQWQ